MTLTIRCKKTCKVQKYTLASSTISQLGFVLAAPAAAGFYALTHGLAKASLFLIAGNLPSRQFQSLRQTSLQPLVWGALAIASFSISGLPLLAGFGAKSLTFKQLDGWQAIVMNLAAVGTAIAFAKFIFLPFANPLTQLPEKAEIKTATKMATKEKPMTGFWIALALLLSGLLGFNGLYPQAYTIETLGKALITVGAGWLVYFLVFRKISLRLPRVLEQFDHLIGVMSLMLTLLFWMVLT
ncbi:MAG: proton-conducting transporter membrane subunit [Cyanobacteria bacterium P01_A01_bin.114]